MKLSTLSQPFIVCVLTEATVAETIATMRLALFDGADAYELNLPVLADAEADELRSIFAAVDRPVYTTCRRAAFMQVYGYSADSLSRHSEEERMQRQLAALALGSAAIDMEMDTFDPHPAPPLGSDEAAAFAASVGEPAELTHDKVALARQQQVIDAAHAAGGEVILSCHTGRPQTTEMLVQIARLAVERGADLVKIVSPCRDMDDLFALLKATTLLKKQLQVPFILVGGGDSGALSRSVGITLGSSYALCQLTLKPGGFHPQPLVSHLREIRRLLPWRYPGQGT